MIKSIAARFLNPGTLHRTLVTSSFLWLLSIILYHFLPPFQSFVEDIFIFTAKPTTYYYAITPALEQQGKIGGGLFTEVVPGEGVRPSTEHYLKPSLRRNAAGTTFPERRVAITYGDKCCLHSKSIMCKSAIANGFTECISYTKQSIDPVFAEQNRGILDQRRGGGYWLWKPYIIFKTLSKLADGDFLFYGDAASYFIADAEPIFKIAKSQNKDIVVFHLNHIPEKRYTKHDAFVLIGCTDEALCKNSTQRLASFLLLRKSLNSLRFVSEYLSYATDERIITDLPSQLGPEHMDFIDHRHDQSVLSLLSKKWGIEAWPDPSQHGSNVKGPTEDISKQVAGKLLIHHRYKF